MSIDTGHWALSCPLSSLQDAWGFVYIITNKLNNKKYIGKKQLKFKKTRKPLKGKVNKRRSMIESDWKEYTGSSTELNADIEKLGKENFTFEIIKFCSSKSTLSYFEIVEQINREALLRSDYYNGIINIRCSRQCLKTLQIS